jgi:hypothetical protein
MSDDDSPLVLVCDHVLALDREVDFIVHHADGMWQLTCGQPDHSTDGSSVRPVHLHHIIDRSPEIANVMLKTPRGHLSERVDGNWTIESHDD